MSETLAAANAAWEKWKDDNPYVCNTDYLPFLAGFQAALNLEDAHAS